MESYDFLKSNNKGKNFRKKDYGPNKNENTVTLFSSLEYSETLVLEEFEKNVPQCTVQCLAFFNFDQSANLNPQLGRKARLLIAI